MEPIEYDSPDENEEKSITKLGLGALVALIALLTFGFIIDSTIIKFSAVIGILVLGFIAFINMPYDPVEDFIFGGPGGSS